MIFHSGGDFFFLHLLVVGISLYYDCLVIRLAGPPKIRTNKSLITSRSLESFLIHKRNTPDSMLKWCIAHISSFYPYMKAVDWAYQCDLYVILRNGWFAACMDFCVGVYVLAEYTCFSTAKKFALEWIEQHFILSKMWCIDILCIPFAYQKWKSVYMR